MSAFMPTVSGRVLRFAEPEVDRDALFQDMAHGLATANRFAGQTPMPYSVAQHCVMGAEAILRETGDVELAAFFLLHDGHEAWLGDWTRPAVEALCEIMESDAVEAGVAAKVARVFPTRVRRGLSLLKRRIDKAVLTAAGFSFPRFEARTPDIEVADIRMLRTERDALLPRQTELWDARVEAAKPFLLRPARLKCWAWPEAEERYQSALRSFCPLLSPPRTPALATA
ncbi:hypothetical protein [Aureimonas sp. AU40]|uniref:hypothetical protein n=1 Tax=Aureimonas sp. AU40 TaxID=1637747 RepID=UPI000784598E|nr:hypothetical protein [Aureimonas sp. AU40]